MKCESEVVDTATTNQEVVLFLHLIHFFQVGVALDNKGIRFKTDDLVEVYEKKEIKQEIAWYPPGFANVQVL